MTDTAGGDSQPVLTVVVYDPTVAAVTGKRVTPPSPTNSDDASHRQKWLHSDDQQKPTSAPRITAEDLFGTAVAPLLVESTDCQDVDGGHEREDVEDGHTQHGDAGREQGKSTAKHKQEPLSKFFAPQSAAEAQAEREREATALKARQFESWLEVYPSPELDDALDEHDEPTSTAGWIVALRGRPVATPANGGCLYFAVHGSRTRTLRGNSMTVCDLHVREGNFYKDQICTTYLNYLESMIATCSDTLLDVYERYVGRAPPSDRMVAVNDVKAFICTIQAADLRKGLSRRQWGGDEELHAYVWYFREPVFVIAEIPDGETYIRILRIDRQQADGPERMHSKTLAPAAAHSYPAHAAPTSLPSDHPALRPRGISL